MASLTLRNIRKAYDDNEVMRDINLDIVTASSWCLSVRAAAENRR